MLNAGREEKSFSLEYLEERLYRPAVALYAVCFGLWCYFNQRCFLRRPVGDRLRGLSLGMMGGSVAGNMVIFGFSLCCCLLLSKLRACVRSFV